MRDCYFHSGSVRLVDAGFQADPDVYCTWAPTRVERDLDQASLHRRHLAAGAPARRVAGWAIEAVAEMADHLAESGFEVVECRGLVHADETDDANPVLGVVDVRRYGFETPAIVRVDDAGARSTSASPTTTPSSAPAWLTVECVPAPEAPSLGW